MKIETSLLAALVAASVVPGALAADAYVGVGTTGFLLGVEHHYSDSFGVRADLNAASISRDTSDSSATYHGTLHLADVGLLADYHPWASGFRLSAGALIGHSKFDAHADGNATGSFTLNGVPVSAAGQSLDASIRFPTVRPYLGLGFGHAPKDTGLNFNADLGVAFGRPDVALTATPTLAQAALSAGTSVDAERNRLQDKVNRLRTYPVLRIGLGWGF